MAYYVHNIVNNNISLTWSNSSDVGRTTGKLSWPCLQMSTCSEFSWFNFIHTMFFINHPRPPIIPKTRLSSLYITATWLRRKCSAVVELMTPVSPSHVCWLSLVWATGGGKYALEYIKIIYNLIMSLQMLSFFFGFKINLDGKPNDRVTFS